MATAIAQSPSQTLTIPSSGGAVTANQNSTSREANTAVVVAKDQLEQAGKFPTVAEIIAQPLVKKSLPGIVLLLVLFAFVMLYLWIDEGDYRSLFPEMTESDSSAAFDLLVGSDIPVRIAIQNGNLEVPVDRYHEARMLLASAGLPQSVGQQTFSDIDIQSSMTTSQFMEEARYTATIENELAKSIVRIATIESARVHIAAARQSAFVRSRTPTKASVVVTPFKGRTVTQSQVQAITYLVSSSVPYLAVNDVSVVDNMGNLLTNSLTPSLTEATLQSGYERSVEEDYRTRIEQLLEPLLGRENIRTDVDVMLDFTQQEVAVEDYDGNGSGPITRSEVLSTDQTSSRSASGVPGATTNVVPNNTQVLDQAEQAQTGGTENGPTSVSNRTTRNYELDRTLRYTRNQVGQLVQMSVAVVLNQNAELAEFGGQQTTVDEALIENVRSLIQGAIGYSAERGDQVTVIATPFRPIIDIPNPVEWYENPSIVALIKLGAVSVAFILLTLLIIRPIVKLYLPKPDLLESTPKALADGELSEEDLAMISLGDGESLEDIKAKLKPKKSTISADMLDTANTYDDKVALIRLLVAEDSGRVANVLKKMIKIN